MFQFLLSRNLNTLIGHILILLQNMEIFILTLVNIANEITSLDFFRIKTRSTLEILNLEQDLRRTKTSRHFYMMVEAKLEDQQLGGWLRLDIFPYLYILCRIFKPKTIVETGVGPGGSSAFILNALEKNNSGHLYSIDLPEHDSVYYPSIGKKYNVHISEEFSTGWLVHPRLRKNWTIILGDAKSELPKLLKNRAIGMFIHDSLHTYEHMMFEYEMAWKSLTKGGLLLSDDVNEYWSLAFIDFCNAKKLTFCIIYNRLGITKKI